MINNLGVVIATIQTDINGNYLVPNLSPGSYQVVALNVNFQAQTKNVTLVPNQTEIVNFALLENPSTLSGTVIDNETGFPLIGVLIEVLNISGIPIAYGLTNQDGQYIIEGLPQGLLLVRVSASSYISQTRQAEIGPGEVDEDFSLTRPLPILGTIGIQVVDALTNVPVANAQIEIVNSEGETIASGFTNEIGQYVVPELPLDTYTIFVSADNYVDQERKVTLVSNQFVSEKFTISPITLGLITGTVVDAQTGSPIVGALVQVFIVGTTIPVKSTFTDVNGHYLVSGLAEGEYRVVISADNYGAQPFRIVLTPGEQETLNAALQPNPASIQGTVTDAQTGNPISGAGVITVITGSGIIVASVKTDLNGNYIISGLAPGSYDVIFSADNFASHTSTVNLVPNETETINAVLTPNPATVSGRIVNAGTSAPITNALIQAFTTGGTFVTSTLSDVNGQYILTGLPEGTFTISASATDFMTQSQTVTLTPNETKTLNFTLSSNPASLSGIVTDAQTKAPLTGTLVEVLVVGATIPVKSTLTDANGHYLVSGLAEGGYRVVISADNYGAQPFRIVLTPGEQETLNAALQPNPASIQGTVTDAQTGNPISGAGVVTVITGSGIIVASAKTDLNGNYIISGLAPGSYDVIFSADNFASQTSTVHLVPNETETINAVLTPNPATVSGRIVNAGTGAPITNALIQAFTTGGTFVTSTLSGVNGQYILTGLPEGTFTISASATDFMTQSQTVTLTPNEIKTLNFTLSSNPASLSGIVTDAQTKAPLTGALVEVLVVGTTIPVKSTLTDANGHYLVSGLAEGEYRVIISADNYGTQPFRIVLTPGKQETLNAALIPNPASIQGTVTDEKTGKPIQGARVELLNNQGKVLAADYTDEQGTFTIRGVPSGTYILRAIAEGFAIQTKPVTVVAGTQPQVDFVLISSPDVGSIIGTVTNQETGKSIEGALVEVLNAQKELVGIGCTDVCGKFAIKGLLANPYTLHIIAEGFLSKIKRITILANTIEKIDIALIPKLTTITGVACDIKTGLHLPNILIELFNIQEEFITNTLTDSNGQYTVCELLAGTFNVKASSKSHLSESRVVALVPGETGVANFALVRKQVLPPETSTDPQQNNIMSEVLLQTLTLNSQVSFKSTKTRIKNSHNIKIQLSDNQSANSLQLSLHLAIALILNIISDTTDSDDLVIQKSIQQSIIKADKQSIVIENSRDITIITNDTDLTANIQLLLQVLVALLVQIDIL
nr:carboxypeptidase regulatory-like domain-containing protein [Priestia aryabhattai]